MQPLAAPFGVRLFFGSRCAPLPLLLLLRFAWFSESPFKRSTSAHTRR
jgi:hypothetical protein